MKKNTLLIFLVATYFILALYIIFYDHVSPRTPRSVINTTFVIKVPRKIAVDRYYDDAAFKVRTVSVGIVLRYRETDESGLIKQCRNQEFNKLPIVDSRSLKAV